MKRTIITLAVLVMVGSSGLLAGLGGEQDLRRHGNAMTGRRAPLVVHASRSEARIIRSIESNRRRMAGLRSENRRLASRLRYVSPRMERSILRKMERNDHRIYRLEKENRFLIRQLRRR